MKRRVNPMRIRGILLLSVAIMFALHRAVQAADPAAAPITADEANAVAMKIEKSIKAGDSTVYEDLLDDDAIVATAAAGLPLTPNQLAQFKAGANLKAKLVQPLVDGAKHGGTYHFLRLMETGGAVHPLFRVLASHGGADYHELTLGRSSDGTPRVVDLYDFSDGELSSQSARRVMVPLAASETRKASQQLIGSDNDFITHINEALEFQNQSKLGHWDQALAVYNRLPESLQHEKSMMILRIGVSEKVSVPVYQKAVDDFESLYPNDPSLLLRKLDLLFASKQYDAAIRDIDQLDQRLGGDAYLGYIRGAVRLAQGRLEDARTFGVAATHLEPTLRQPWDLLIDLSVRAKDNAATVRLLDESSNVTGVRWTKIGTARLFADFVKSPEYAEWVKTHPQNAGNLGPKPDELRLN